MRLYGRSPDDIFCEIYTSPGGDSARFGAWYWHHRTQPYEFRFQNLLDTWLYFTDAVVVLMAVIYTLISLSGPSTALDVIGWFMLFVVVGAVVAAAVWLTVQWWRGKLKMEALYADDNRSTVYTAATDESRRLSRQASSLRLASAKSFVRSFGARAGVRGHLGAGDEDAFDVGGGSGRMFLGWNGMFGGASAKEDRMTAITEERESRFTARTPRSGGLPSARGSLPSARKTEGARGSGPSSGPFDSTSSSPGTSSGPLSGALAVVGDQGDDVPRSGELPPIPRTSRASRKSSLTPRGGRESRVSRLRDAAGAVVDAVGDLRRPSPTPRQPQPEARRGTAIVTRGQEGLISDAI